jgi:hypothetical protein
MFLICVQVKVPELGNTRAGKSDVSELRK